VCPGDASEDLDEVTLVPGLAVVPFTVDVHAAQWGTLNRAIATVGSRRLTAAMAIDEDTAVEIADAGGAASVVGLGLVHTVSAAETGVHVRSWRAGEQIDVDLHR
jgi:cyanophycinase